MHRIFGTEEDKVNCSFYFKIGACRHGERCSRLHMKPNFSQTLLLAHFYMPPYNPNAQTKPEDDNEHYEEFYEDVLNEFLTYGDVEELVICENLGDHMFGNTYVKFSTEEQASKALVNLRGRYYGGRIIQVEYSPVTDFREGRCRQFDEHNCLRGGYCNFLHLKQTPKFAKHYLRRARLRSRYRFDGRSSRRHKKEESESEEEWDSFPMRGSSEERRYCIMKWNKLLNERRERQKKKDKKNQNNDDHNNDNIIHNNNSNNSNNNKTNNDITMKNNNNGVNNNGNQNSENNNTNANNNLLQSLPLVPPQTVMNNEIKMNDPYVNPERLRMIGNY